MTTTYLTREEIEEMILKIQPHYENMNNRFSKSYLKGSSWYVGDNLLEWWRKCNNIRYFSYNIQKLRYIVLIVETDLKNNLK